MKNYSVSILIPVYKVSDFIERCAESVFSQTFESIEYIFVDDASPDDSIQKLEQVLVRFPNRKEDVRILRNEKNRGISDSRQIAFDNAHGKYFLAMDSDDWIEKEMVEKLVQKAENENSDITYCSYFRTFSNNEIVEKPLFSSDKKMLIKDALNGKSAYWNKLIRLDLLKENNIKTISGVNMADDLVVLVKLIYYAQKISFIDTPLYHYVQFNENACTKELPIKHINDHITVTEDVENFFESKSDFLDYQKMVLQFKAKRKIKIIRGSFANKKHLLLYPDLYQQIDRLDLPLKSRIILQLAHNHNLKRNYNKIIFIGKNVNLFFIFLLY